MTPSVAVVDLGTSSVRVSLIRADGTPVALARRDLPIDAPAPGIAAQSAQRWWEATIECFVELGVSQFSVRAVTVTNQQISTVPVDEDGVPLDAAILWMDQRTAEIASEFTTAESDLIRRTTGMPVSASWAALRPLWWRRHRPDVFQRTAAFLTADAFLIRHLTGRSVTDPSNACFSVMNLTSRALDLALCAELDLDPDLFPPIIDTGQFVGPISPEASQATGLSADTPVVLAGSDQPCAALGLGALRHGSMAATSGTGTFMLTHVDQPLLDPRLLTNAAAVPNTWLLHGVHYLSGAAWSWLSDLLFDPGSPVTRAERYQLMARWAQEVTPGDDGPTFLPYFQGARTPYFNDAARATIHGLDLSHGRGHICRALLESNGFGIRQTLDVLSDLDHDIETVHLAGAPAGSDAWCQLQADITGRQCVRTTTTEATTTGAALIALVATGHYSGLTEAIDACVRTEATFEPREERTEIYDRRYDAYCSLYNSLADGAPA